MVEKVLAMLVTFQYYLTFFLCFYNNKRNAQFMNPLDYVFSFKQLNQCTDEKITTNYYISNPQDK